MMISTKKNQKYNLKFLGLIILILCFGFFYTFLDASNFQGLNPIQDKIKDNIVEEEVRESYKNYKDGDTQALKENVEEVVEEEEEKIKTPSTFQNVFDKLYFSTITSCLLGYGDIYPATNTTKALTALQSFLTVTLILY
jgi:hypothetical protein